MPMSNNLFERYRCADCLHKHYWTQGKTFTLVDQKRVVAAETNLGSWGMCEDESCTCIALRRLTANQLETLLNKAEEYCGRPIGHRPPGVVIPNEPQPGVSAPSGGGAESGSTGGAGRLCAANAATVSDVGF